MRFHHEEVQPLSLESIHVPHQVSGKVLDLDLLRAFSGYGVQVLFCRKVIA